MSSDEGLSQLDSQIQEARKAGQSTQHLEQLCEHQYSEIVDERANRKSMKKTLRQIINFYLENCNQIVIINLYYVRAFTFSPIHDFFIYSTYFSFQSLNI